MSGPLETPPRGVRLSVTPSRWMRIEPLIDAALDLLPAERRGYYDRLVADDPVLGADVERLVNGCGLDDSVIEPAAAERFAILLDEHKIRDERDALDAVTATQFRTDLETALGAGYALGPELHHGGMSRVFLAEERTVGRPVVVKALAPERAAGISAERFEREIEILASLRHSNIVPLLAAGRTPRVRYYTMPRLDGRALRERIGREGALPIADAMTILRDVARALAHAHERNIVHRDVKPSNVLLSGGAAFVCDFGIAKTLSAAGAAIETPDALTQAGVGIGTPGYMSPEQAAGDPTTDHRTDLYAFGCLAYEVLTGRSPFHGRTIHATIMAQLNETPPTLARLRSDAPPPVAELVARCLEKRPNDRPQTADELLAGLGG